MLLSLSPEARIQGWLRPVSCVSVLSLSRCMNINDYSNDRQPTLCNCRVPITMQKTTKPYNVSAPHPRRGTRSRSDEKGTCRTQFRDIAFDRVSPQELASIHTYLAT